MSDPPLADRQEVVVLEVETIAVGVVIGATIGRWWSILLVVPAGLVAQGMYSFEGFSDTGVAVNGKV